MDQRRRRRRRRRPPTDEDGRSGPHGAQDAARRCRTHRLSTSRCLVHAIGDWAGARLVCAFTHGIHFLLSG